MRERCRKRESRSFFAVPDHARHRSQSLHRFAQRTSGQHALIPAAAPVKNDQFGVALQTVVLQAIVRDDDIALGIRGQQRTAGCNAIAPDGDRHLAAPCEQQRLVTDHTGVRISPDDLFTFSAPANMQGTTLTASEVRLYLHNLTAITDPREVLA